MLYHFFGLLSDNLICDQDQIGRCAVAFSPGDGYLMSVEIKDCLGCLVQIEKLREESGNFSQRHFGNLAYPDRIRHVIQVATCRTKICSFNCRKRHGSGESDVSNEHYYCLHYIQIGLL